MTPSLEQLVKALDDSRGSMKLAELARRTHYSVSALSDATSGKRIPTESLIRSYAAACDMDPKPLLALRQQAVAEKVSETPGKGRAEPPAAPTVRQGTTDVVRHTISGIPLPRTRAARRDDEPPAHAAASDTETDMAALIQQAMASAGRSNAPVHVDPITGALSLCTVPQDLMELLNALWRRSAISLREMEQLVRRQDLAISKSSLHKILNDKQLPPVDVLAAIVSACGMTQDQVDVWLYHRARLEIAEVRHMRTGSTSPWTEGAASWGTATRVSYGSGRNLTIFLAACSLVAALLPLLMRL